MSISPPAATVLSWAYCRLRQGAVGRPRSPRRQSDLIVAEEGTKFQVTEAPRGLSGAKYWALLNFRGGGSLAVQVSLTGRFFTAEEALRVNIIDQVAPKGEHLAAAQELARSIAKNPPLGVRHTVQLRRWELKKVQQEAVRTVRAAKLNLSEDFLEFGARFRGKAARRPVQGTLTDAAEFAAGRRSARYRPADRSPGSRGGDAGVWTGAVMGRRMRRSSPTSWSTTRCAAISSPACARILTIAEEARNRQTRTEPAIVRETASSALVDGGNTIGYIAAFRGAEIAARKAKDTGLSIVGVFNSFYSGRNAWYVETIVRHDLVAIHTCSASPHVLPPGSRAPLLGTNPISIGFPSTNGPVVWDIGTASVMWGDVQLMARLGHELPEGTGFDQDGNPTRDAAAALKGGVAPWGGHKGYGLSFCIQALGLIAGAALGLFRRTAKLRARCRRRGDRWPRRAFLRTCSGHRPSCHWGRTAGARPARPRSPRRRADCRLPRPH